MNTYGMYRLNCDQWEGYQVLTLDGDVLDSFDTKQEALDLLRALTH